MPQSSQQDPQSTSWAFLGRVLLKAMIGFAACNLVFALIYPIEWLGQWSLYGTIYQVRTRLPYGENPSQSYNISLTNLPAMFASHEVNQLAADDTYRVFLIGDSNTWGWLLEHDQTLGAQLNAANIYVDSREAYFSNLGYPVMSLTKDLLILDEAMQYQPDAIIWLVSLASFPPEQQFLPPLVQDNQHRLASFDDAIDLNRYRIQPDQTQWWQRSIIAERRPLADLLRLQTYGLSWMATGIDQAIPDEIPLRQSDFDRDLSWSTFDEPMTLTAEHLALDVLQAGIDRAGDVPVVIINEPMFISTGRNSDVRYNSFYPRWAYDQYRELMATTATARNWRYHDLWDTIAPDEFTDSPVHLSDQGTAEFARLLTETLYRDEE